MQCNNVKIFVFLIFLEIFIRDFMNILYLWFLSFFFFFLLFLNFWIHKDISRNSL